MPAAEESTSSEYRLDAIISPSVKVELLRYRNAPRTLRRFEFNPVPDLRMANVWPSA